MYYLTYILYDKPYTEYVNSMYIGLDLFDKLVSQGATYIYLGDAKTDVCIKSYNA